MVPKLFTPGPVDLLPEISSAQGKPMLSHRGSEEYRQLQARIIESIKKLLVCDEGIILTASGTGGVEACVSSAILPGEAVLVPQNGIFGERLFEACAIHGAGAVGLKLDYGKGFSLERVKAEIDARKPAVLAMVLNETSTGVCNKAREICLYAKEKGALVIVDGVSGVGGHEFSMKVWGVDLCAVGSQKCIGAPPGLSVIGLSGVGAERVRKVKPRTRYFDLGKYLEFNAKSETPFTPAVSLMFGLDAAFSVLFKEGVDARIERHKKAGEVARRTLSEASFTLFAEEGFESNTVTSFAVSGEDEAGAVRKGVLRKGFEIAGGMGAMKGKVMRIGHMGNFSQEDLMKCLRAITSSGNRY